MNNKIIALLALASLTLTQQSFTGGGQDNSQVTIKKEDIRSIKIECGQGATGCQQIIVAEGSTASKVMGAAGDNESYDTADAEKNITNFQRITQNDKVITLAVPSEGKKLYSITPTEGPHANKAARVLLYVFSLDKPFPAGTPERVAKEAQEAKAQDPKRHTAIKVYKQPSGATQYNEVLSIYTPETGNLGNLKIKLDKQGNFVIPQFYGADIKGNLTTLQ